MRPPRDDIAAPPFPPATEWIGPEPAEMTRLAARGPVLVHFFEVGEPSGVRTLPYVSGWHQRYAGLGLTVLAVHSPRSPVASERDALAAALRRLGVPYPVAHDPGHRIWHDYGCRGWPSLFLWGRGGALRWFQFGEGEYAATEEAIHEELWAADADPMLPDPLPPRRPADAPGARVVPPSDELFPGGALDRPWATDTGEPLEVEYAGGGAQATLDGEGEVGVSVDGGPRQAIEVTAPGVYELAEHGRHGAHELRLELPPTVRCWSLGFAPGTP